jgi:hypothetical protein
MPVALVVQPRACVAHKSPLTNRIRRHFARIKAAGLDSGRSWLLQQIQLQIASGDAQETFGERPGRREAEGQDTSNMKVRRFRRRKSGHFEDESQDISKTKVRTFRRRKSGDAQDISQAKVRTRRGRRPARSCRPPFHFRLRHACANDAPFPPRSPARRCDRPAGRSARRD